MGRPEDCNCCEDFGNPPLPPITDCDGAICIAFIDENNDSNGRDTVDAKFAEWVKAFPNRILFVVDVFVSNPLNPNGTPKLYFPDGWDDHNNAFNLRGEFIRGLSVPEFCNRDNGDVGLATDIWAALTTIAADRGISAELASATDVSIFVDTTNSMPDGTVLAAYNLLVSEAESAGKTITTSTFNSDEDYICPFVNSTCCNNEFVKPLQDLCNVTPTCEPAYLKLTNRSLPIGSTNFLIREYIDYDPDNPPSEEWYSIYGGVERVYALEYAGAGTAYEANTTDQRALVAETNDQQLVMLAEVTNSEGTSLDFVDINYTIEYSDDNGVTWTEIENLGNRTSGQTLTKKFLVDDYGGSSASAETVHTLLGDTVNNYTTTTWEARFNARRIYDRDFRIVASAPDYPALGSVAFGFKLEEYRVAGRTGATVPDPEVITNFLIDYHQLNAIFLNTSLFRCFKELNFVNGLPVPTFGLLNNYNYGKLPENVYYGVDYRVGGQYIQEDFNLSYEYRDKIDLAESSSTGSCWSTETIYTNWIKSFSSLGTGTSNANGVGSKNNKYTVSSSFAEGMSISMYDAFSRLQVDDGYPLFDTGISSLRTWYNSDLSDPKNIRGEYQINDSVFSTGQREELLEIACYYRSDRGIRYVKTEPVFRLEDFKRLYFKDGIWNDCARCWLYYDDQLVLDYTAEGRSFLRYFGIEVLRSNREYRFVATINNTDTKIYSPVFRPLFLCYDRRFGSYANQYIPCDDICS